MKRIRKLLTACLMSSAFVFNIQYAHASNIADVPDGYWAEGAIVSSLQQGFLGLKRGWFNPEASISRAEFADAIYRVINRSTQSHNNNFIDIYSTTLYRHSILGLSELRVIFGYPDGNFLPEAYTKKCEAASVIANIIRGDYSNPDVLNRYADKDEIPSWAKASYINNIVNDINVNYPQMNKLNPNAPLTRAEAAVLIVKLKNALDNYKASYMKGIKEREAREAAIREYEANKRPIPSYVSSGTLTTMKNAYKNAVNYYDIEKVIEAGNMVPVRSSQQLDARTVSVGEQLTYYSPKDIYSDQGVKLYSAGTRFVATVEDVEKSYWLKNQHKAYIVFRKAILRDGNEFPIAGVLYTTYRGQVVPESKKDTARIQSDIVKQFSKREMDLKFAGKLTPMVKYHEDGKNNIFMLLTADMIIPETNSAL